MEYQDNNGAMEPLRVHTVVISVQHIPEISLEEIRHHLIEKVVKVIIPAKYLDDKTIYHLLPSGKFLCGGPQVSEDESPEGNVIKEKAINQECVKAGVDRCFCITRVTQDSQGVKSSWTRMEAGVATEEEPSLGKITPKWIGPELTPLAGSPSP